MDWRPKARVTLETARSILASMPLEEWLKPENLPTYKYLTEHVIPEAEGFLRYIDSPERQKLLEEERRKIAEERRKREEEKKKGEVNPAYNTG